MAETPDQQRSYRRLAAAPSPSPVATSVAPRSAVAKSHHHLGRSSPTPSADRSLHNNQAASSFRSSATPTRQQQQPNTSRYQNPMAPGSSLSRHQRSAHGEVSSAGTFVVSDAIVAMVVVEGRFSSSSSSSNINGSGNFSNENSNNPQSSSSSEGTSVSLAPSFADPMMPTTVWTADERGWIRIRDPATGDVTRQWRCVSNSSSNNINSNISINSSITSGGAAKVSAMWASPIQVPSQFAVVLIGREDGIISVYSAATAAPLADLALHEGLISGFTQCDADCTRVASCSFDGRIALWDARSLRCITTVVCSKLEKAAQLCMAAFPVSKETWWIASGGNGGSLFVHRASDLCPVARQSYTKNSSASTSAAISPPKDEDTVDHDGDGHDINNGHNQHRTNGRGGGDAAGIDDVDDDDDDLFAMTAIVCSYRQDDQSGPKYVWCGYSDGSIQVFRAAISSSGGAEKVQSLFPNGSGFGSGRGVSIRNSNQFPSSSSSSSHRHRHHHQPAISHMMTNPGEDRIWVFTVDGYLTVFDSVNRVVLQRMVCSSGGSFGSDLNNINNTMNRRGTSSRDVMTCVSPISVSRTWRIWTASDDGSVRVWTSQQQQILDPSSSSSSAASQSGSANLLSGGGDAFAARIRAVPIQEVETLRSKVDDLTAQLDRANEKEESMRKIAALDMEENLRRCNDDVRAAELARADATEQLAGFKQSALEVEKNLKQENSRLEVEIQRLQRVRSIDRASSVPRASGASLAAANSEVENLRTQLAESRAQERTATAALVSLQGKQQQPQQQQQQHHHHHHHQQQQPGQIIVAANNHHRNGNSDSKNDESPQRLKQLQQQQQQQHIQDVEAIAGLKMELERATALMSRQEDRISALAAELERKNSDYDKLHESTATVRASLEEAMGRAVKAEQQLDFMRRELANAPSQARHYHQHHAGGGMMASPISPPATPLAGGVNSNNNNNTLSNLALLGSRQEELASLEQAWQEKQSNSIRDAYELRQQVERKSLEVKTLENDVRQLRQESDALRSELRSAVDENARRIREAEDEKLSSERQLREARAEERRSTENEVSTQYRARMVQLERELQQAMDKSSKLETNFNFCQDELRTMEKRREATIQRDTVHLQELQKVLAQTTEKLKNKEVDIGRMEARHEHEVQELRAEVMAAQREAENQKRAREGLETAARRQLSLVSSEMNAVDADVQQLHRQLGEGSVVIQRAALQDQISALKEQLEFTQRELAAKRSSSVHFESEINKREAMLLSEKSETTRLRTESETLQRQTVSLREEISTLQTKLSSAQRDSANSLDSAEKRFKAELENARATIAQTHNDSIKIRTELDMMNRNLLETTSRHNTSLLEAKAEFAKEKAELVAKLEAAEREISSGSVQQQLAAWQRRLEDSATERESLRETVATLRRQLEQAERTNLQEQTDRERQIQELRRATIVENTDTVTKITRLEQQIESLRQEASAMKDQREEHMRECPLKNASVTTMMADAKRLQHELEDAKDNESKIIKKAQGYKMELAEVQKQMAEKEFDHVRELKMVKVEHEHAIRRLESEHSTGLHKSQNTSGKRAGEERITRRRGGGRRRGYNNYDSDDDDENDSSNNNDNDDVAFEDSEGRMIELPSSISPTMKRQIRSIRDQNEYLEKRHRQSQREIENLRRKLRQEQQQQPQPHGATATHHHHQHADNNNNNMESVHKLKQQLMILQKEKAALQMQLMKRDDQMHDLETNHITKMLDEVNQLRLARDKAMLDCNRMANDVQQLQKQLQNEAQVRNTMSSRVDANTAHVTTVHGSLRAVMMEAAQREQQLESDIRKLQESLRSAREEKSRAEDTAAAVEQAVVSSTVKSMQVAENQLTRLLQSLLLVLEYVRDKPHDRLESVMSTIVSCVETATQVLSTVRSEAGFVSAGQTSLGGNASVRMDENADPFYPVQQQQQQQHRQYSTNSALATSRLTANTAPSLGQLFAEAAARKGKSLSTTALQR